MKKEAPKSSSSIDRFIVWLVDRTKPLYSKWFKKKVEPWPVKKADLLKFPENTLGRTLGEFLEREQLELMPKMEDHDVFHVLLKFQTTIKDEIRMQFFLIGNGKKSLYAIFTVLTGIILQPKNCKTFYKTYQTGRKCLSVAKWDFRHLLNEPIELLQNQIYRRAMPEEAPLFI